MEFMEVYRILLILLPVGHALSTQTESSCLHNSFLSRRVRAVIFPKQASILVTAALTKVIVGGRPSGLQYSLEYDMYLPLPDSLEGWRPNILLGPPIKEPIVEKLKSRWDGNWRIKPATQHKNSFYQSPWKLSEQPWHRPTPPQETYESWSDVPGWKLHRGYRERREIFDQLEAMGNFFRLDLKSCIKRAMCELQARFNQHHGHNLLMEDLLRIVLTLPEDIYDDKYRQRYHFQNTDCARHYAVSCPYSVLEFLTQNSETK